MLLVLTLIAVELMSVTCLVYKCMNHMQTSKDVVHSHKIT